VFADASIGYCRQTGVGVRLYPRESFTLLQLTAVAAVELRLSANRQTT